MKIKGFTLIELLAVIVILAIITLIATPIILNIINDSKNSATVRSGELYLKAVEQAVARENLKEEFNPSNCDIQSDGNLLCGDKTIIVETEGTKPIEGTINFQKGKITTVEGMLLDGYVLNKEANKNLVVFGKLEDITPQGTYLMTIPTVSSSDSYFLGQEQIKRNQVEKITIKNRKTVPSNAIYSWDVSEAKDSSVMAWYLDSDNNNLYELYIGGDGGVKANPNSSHLFRCFDKATTIDVTYLNTKDVTTMYNMFSSCSNLTTLDLSKWNTSKVTYMVQMFWNCQNLTSLDLSTFDTSKVTDMQSIFYKCTSLTNLDLSNFDTSKVTNMRYMFYDCNNLTTLNLNNFNTSQVIYMNHMFSRCNNLTSLDLSNFDTSKVTNMRDMFSDCKSLTSLNLNGFNTSQVINMVQMFADCSLTSLDLSSFDTSNVTDMSSMFYNCQELITLDIRKATFTSIAENKNPSFTQCYKLTTIYVKDNDAKTFIDNVVANKAVIAS